MHAVIRFGSATNKDQSVPKKVGLVGLTPAACWPHAGKAGFLLRERDKQSFRAKAALPDNKYRAAPVSTLADLANRKTELIKSKHEAV